MVEHTNDIMAIIKGWDLKETVTYSNNLNSEPIEIVIDELPKLLDQLKSKGYDIAGQTINMKDHTACYTIWLLNYADHLRFWVDVDRLSDKGSLYPEEAALGLWIAESPESFTTIQYDNN